MTLAEPPSDAPRDAAHPRHVLIVAQPAAFAGAEIHTLRFAQACVSRGTRVEVIEAGGTEHLVAALKATGPREGISVTATDLSTETNSVGSLLRWLRLLRRPFRYSVLMQNNWPDSLGASFLLAARLSSPRVLVATHGWGWPSLVDKADRGRFGLRIYGPWWYRDQFQRRIPDLLSHGTVAVCSAHKAFLVEHYHYRPDRTTVIRNGVDVRTFERDGSAADRFRASLGVSTHERLIAMTVRLHESKSVDTALRAFAAARRQSSARPSRLVIAGEGPDRASLERLAADLDLGDAVVFTGQLADVRPLLWASDCILLTSRVEVFPFSLLEGLAAGCVPIASTAGGVPEILRAFGVDAIPIGDTDAFAAAIGRLLAMHDDELAAAKVRARETAEREFLAETSYAALLDALACSHRGMRWRPIARPD